MILMFKVMSFKKAVTKKKKKEKKSKLTCLIILLLSEVCLYKTYCKTMPQRGL